MCDFRVGTTFNRDEDISMASFKGPTSSTGDNGISFENLSGRTCKLLLEFADYFETLRLQLQLKDLSINSTGVQSYFNGVELWSEQHS